MLGSRSIPGRPIDHEVSCWGSNGASLSGGIRASGRAYSNCSAWTIETLAAIRDG
jgi:hypothetical protein